MKDAEMLKSPLMISEFGACSSGDVCERELNQVLDQCDRGLASWAYWQFKQNKDSTTTSTKLAQGIYDFDGNLQWKKIRALSRPYQRKTQGTLLSMSFDVDEAHFKSTF